jgi:hypothetical protein
MKSFRELREHIVKVAGGYELKSKKTGRNLGRYPSRAGAEKRERQVQYFKHMGEEYQRPATYPDGKPIPAALPKLYQPASNDGVPKGQNCANCSYYVESSKKCTLWKNAVVKPLYWCAKWKAAEVKENFKDGRHPEDRGDSARYGLTGKSAAELKSIRSSDSASPRKKQLAHWLLNMHH